MSCLGWFKRRSRSGGSRSGGGGSSGKRGASAPPSGPATTTTTTTTTTLSAVSTSRSDDSGAVRPVSKSAGSAGSSLSQQSISSLYEERGHGQLRVFDYEELQAATAEFGRAQKLGEGGFGSVYKGFVRAADGKGDRIPVAVKKLNQRGLQVQGLAYLHEGVEVQVIYRDFKTSNILLDKDFRAKLSDFGLAREGPTGPNTHVSTAVVGTQGYAAPEYMDTGHLTAKSDVWSFGVVLYEILTGRRSLDRNKPAAEQKLLEWVAQFPPDSRNFRMIMDPRFRGEYSVKAAREIAKLADSCLLKNAKERPTMSEVVEVLRRAVQAAEPDSRAPAAIDVKGKRADAAAPPRR
ncbi:putative receptor-like protein kinase [Dichanthelium oligosanthes]|uniref:Putative receptor-like protein kinase n=1 Tax=Dichanthelium oligosanthes TaxID=888268 RepID=A0A1E5V4H0_9POAL|nr:putative receptor-like protein kinase [Dichanthelium oligosanthes]